ncbi:hypothetical protein C9374_003624 [Naegleria lovaniensis]|uniref:40S ribosomal protein S30 n=1 Tax=Naegleria lovaniensis TaxID=51637 RepID=A0AA88GZK8_NAELO|nr:uncharacterized protein C9374_003624 [Naegleria lovaniensis]KAG2393860.1 hypothetical protein C9374_003624 [Naegleria lovaniensis]
MGKQHGSLARAGKVKNQTPKVEPQKKTGKDMTGRSKKRFLFNKRYASLKTGQDPLRMKLNSIEMQVAMKEQKKHQAEIIAEKKKLLNKV